ncbi:MAG: pyridoxamine 5'-phosphate oxidase family protein, partial [Promethearchaeota archaeon]
MSSRNDPPASKKSREQIIKDAINYIETHDILTMATASLDGIPNATALEYGSDGLDVFVFSRARSWKVNNIRENPRVFYEIHDNIKIEPNEMRRIIGVQVEAKTRIIEQGSEQFQKYLTLMRGKFPVFRRLEDFNDRVILLFKPARLWLLDYSKKFFHRDFVDLG